MTPAERLVILKRIGNVVTFSKPDFCRVLITLGDTQGVVGTGGNLDQAIDSAYESLRNRVLKEVRRIHHSHSPIKKGSRRSPS